jgi:hypothetical protein
MSIGPRFEFYEIVRIQPQSSALRQLQSLEGAVLGRSENPDGTWGYAIFVYSLNETWDLPEAVLEPTGRSDSRETFYDGTSITVIVDPDTGEGHLP